jgi:hypothetical protein
MQRSRDTGVKFPLMRASEGQRMPLGATPGRVPAGVLALRSSADVRFGCPASQYWLSGQAEQ